MTREELVKDRSAAWRRLEALIAEGSRATGLRRLRPGAIHELSELYRALAGDLMRVRRDKLGADLERWLDDLAGRAHNLIYAGSEVGSRGRAIDLVFDFPGAIRRNGRFFLLAVGLFYGPLIAAGTGAYLDESIALALMKPEQLEGMEEMYRHAKPGTRDPSTDALMTGFYVQHNVGIAFNCFATGITFGLGSIVYLFFNGLTIGVVLGHLARVGLGPMIFGFIAAHSPWELTAIAIAGGAGLQMGFALVSTGGRTRIGNVVAHGLELLRQVIGCALFLGVAACLEGWVSPSGAPVEVKYFLGALGFVAVGVFLALGGGDRPVPPDVLALRAQAARPPHKQEAV